MSFSLTLDSGPERKTVCGKPDFGEKQRGRAFEKELKEGKIKKPSKAFLHRSTQRENAESLVVIGLEASREEELSNFLDSGGTTTMGQRCVGRAWSILCKASGGVCQVD